MKKILRLIDSLSEWSGKISSYLVYVGILMLASEVVLRYFFDSPTVWAHGYSQRIFGSYFVMIGAFTLFQNGHVRIDIIYQKFSLRKRAFFDIFNYCMMLIWTLFLVKEGITFFAYSWKIGEVDEMVLAHPVYPVKFLLVVGAILITLQGLNRLFVSVMTFVKGVKYEY
jgi:TRAP-type mannitol/chloroaromatic compound transport system permease small subunit